MEDSDIVQILMGDRYDKLRLNHLDMCNNSGMVEKCWKILADNVLSKSCKTLASSGSLNAHLPVIVKVIYITDAYENRIKELKAKMKEGFLKFKLYLFS